MGRVWGESVLTILGACIMDRVGRKPLMVSFVHGFVSRRGVT